jgi:hypothetical protein
MKDSFGLRKWWVAVNQAVVVGILKNKQHSNELAGKPALIAGDVRDRW